jgi:hypothetical protein
MSDQSSRLRDQTLKDSPNVTSSPESVDGATHYSSQGGMQLDLFGQEVHPANPSQSPEISEVKKTNDTSGLTSSISSASANLQSFLANKLAQQLEQSGSMIYKLTWKQKVTPRQWQYCQLAASALRTKGNDSSSWPTPMHTDGTKMCNRYRENFQNGLGAIASTIDPWATPTVRDYKNTGNLENYIFGSPTGRVRADSTSTQAYLISHWPSPIAVDYENSPSQEYFDKTKRNPMTNQLRDAVVHAWGTPNAMDSMGARSDEALARAKKKAGCSNVKDQVPVLSTAETKSTVKYQLNPRFSLWLMGYPIEWAYCGEQVTPSSRKSQRKSSKQ